MRSETFPSGTNIRTGTQRSGARFPLILLLAFVAIWVALAIAPRYRQDWLLENVLVFVAVPVFVLTYRSLRFTNTSYLALFVFFVLHEIGAHYTYSEVPYDAWFTAYLGFSPNHYFALSRNDYDRFVHAMYGLLMTPVANELFANRAAPRGLWRWVFPVTFIMSHSLIYELVEWFAAVHFGGNLGAAYLGSQGDPWDAQRDMLLASMGSILSMGIIMASRAWSHRTRQATSDSTLR